VNSRAVLALALIAVAITVSNCDKSDKPREGVVSLSPVVTEILCELGAGDRIVANTRLCNYPEDARGKTKVGDFFNVNEEAIISLRPEMVIDTTSKAHRALWERLSGAGIEVVHCPIETVDEVAAAYEKIGRAVGLEEKGRELSQRFLSDLNNLKAKCADVSQRKRVIFFVEYPNLTAAGKGTFIDDFISAVGGENVVAQSGWVKNFPIEKLVELKPDVIIQAIDGDKLSDEIITDIDGFFEFANVRVFVIDADETTRPGPRIVKGWAGMAKILHPELFEN